MAAYRRVDDLLPVHRDQLQAQRSALSMGKPLPFLGGRKPNQLQGTSTDVEWPVITSLIITLEGKR